jgi:hypothetical protein
LDDLEGHNGRRFLGGRKYSIEDSIIEYSCISNQIPVHLLFTKLHPFCIALPSALDASFHRPAQGRRGRKSMKISKVISAALAIVLSTVFAVSASAQCGAAGGSVTTQFRAQPNSWQTSAQTPAAPNSATAPTSIVGFWKVTFVSEGNPGIPDGTVIDFGYAQWHSDGTEILNSGARPPATGNFCLGVWAKTGHTYRLNHFAISSDPSGNLIGPANIRESVALGASGNSYSGSFTIDQFDQSGNVLAHIAGDVIATRITPDTQP